jgi:hypothetical protein
MWDALGPELKELAVMAAAVKIGCGWYIDFGHWVGVAQGSRNTARSLSAADIAAKAMDEAA